MQNNVTDRAKVSSDEKEKVIPEYSIKKSMKND